MITADNFILFVSLLLLFCIIFSRFLSKAGIPVLVFFIFAGMFMGSEGIGGLYFNEPRMASSIGNLAICYILFAGGMTTNWKTARPVLIPSALLASVGVMLTAILIGFIAYFLVGLSMLEGLLLGSVVSCTDAASVFSILRSKDMNLKGSLAPLLELESSSNDPAAYMLTITVLSLMTNPGGGFFHLIKMLALQISVGVCFGLLFGRIGAWMINRVKLGNDGLYPAVAVAIAAFIYSSIQTMHGNGFLGIYIAGMVMGNVTLLNKGALVRFFDGLSWLMQIIVFVTLGLLVFPSQLPEVLVPGIILSVALMFVVRPLAVFPILAWFDYSLKDNLLVSWVGFRGASSIVFATYALSEGLPAGSMIFNLVFFISLTSVIFQGSMLAPIARILDQLETNDSTLVSRTFTDYGDDLMGTLYELRVVKKSPAVNMRVKDLHFPSTARILIIKRGESTLTPIGKTSLMEGDVLMVTANKTDELILIKERLGFA